MTRGEQAGRSAAGLGPYRSSVRSDGGRRQPLCWIPAWVAGLLVMPRASILGLFLAAYGNIASLVLGTATPVASWSGVLLGVLLGGSRADLGVLERPAHRDRAWTHPAGPAFSPRWQCAEARVRVSSGDRSAWCWAWALTTCTASAQSWAVNRSTWCSGTSMGRARSRGHRRARGAAAVAAVRRRGWQR